MEREKILFFLFTLFLETGLNARAQITVDFVASDHDICQQQSVNFTDLSTGTITDWAWNFSWGAAPQIWYGQTAPPITFNMAGGFLISLTVTDVFGNSYTKYDTINVYPLPQLNVAPPNPVVCKGNPIVLKASANTAGNFFWVFQNDTVSTDSTFAANAGGPVSVYFRDINSCQSLNYVYVNQSMLGAVSLNSSSQIMRDTVNFCQGGYNYLYASSNYYPIDFVWSNGDVGSSLSVDSPGLYSVTATDYLGCGLTSRTLAVQIHTPPEAPPIVLSTLDTLCEGNPVELAAPDGYAGYNWYGYFGSQKSITVYYSGVFTLRVMDENGCESLESSVTLDFYPQPWQPYIVVGDDCYLGASLIEDVVYQWFHENNPILGANGQFFQADNSGFYTVMVTNTDGCSSTSGMVYASCLPSGIDENVPISGVSVYPNPFSEVLIVRVPGDGKYQFSLIDILGKEIREGTFKNNIRIERDNLPAGVYSLNLSEGGEKGKISARIIAQ